MISLFDPPGSKPGRRAIRPAVFGAVALASVIAVAGCGGGSSGGTSSSSGTSQTSTLRKCLEEHGVTSPPGAGGGGGGGGATPHARPTGSTSSSFRQAVQDCGGSAGLHGGSAG